MAASSALDVELFGDGHILKPDKSSKLTFNLYYNLEEDKFCLLNCSSS